MTARFSLIALTVLVSLCHGVQQDALWTLSLTVSDTPGSEYEGPLEMKVVFDDKTQHAIIFPSTKFMLGMNYDFPIGLVSAGPVQAVYLRTRGFCPLGLLPVDVLRLSRLQLVSKSTGQAYTKEVKDLAIKDLCQSNSQGTQFADFQVDTVQECKLEGSVHQHGEKFEIGCAGRCQCMNGTVSCMDMCPPEAWDPDRQCKFIRMPGRCCEKVVCMDGDAISKCQEAKPGLLITEDKKPVRRYPWSMMFCFNEKCSQIYGGVLVGERHILTFAPDTSYLKRIFISTGQSIIDQTNMTDFTPARIVNVTAHEDFINPDSPIANAAARLQVIEMEEPIELNKFVQTANLPLDSDHCRQLSTSQCPFMTVGWDRTDTQDDSIRQWWLHAVSSTKGDEDGPCPRSNSTAHGPAIIPKRRGDKRSCLTGLSREDCTGPSGGAVVANAGDNVDFVVGLTDPDSALLFCERPGTADVLPLCKYIDWIDSLTR